MIDDPCSTIPIQERLKFQTYQMLYKNVSNRRCRHVEVLPYDFLESQHEAGVYYLQQYQRQPMQYICRTHTGLIGDSVLESNYLVVAGREHVALLREPGQALARHQPFLMVFDGKVFQPHDGNAVDYWQRYIEPVVHESSNVLTGCCGSMGVIPGSLLEMASRSLSGLRQYH